MCKVSIISFKFEIKIIKNYIEDSTNFMAIFSIFGLYIWKNMNLNKKISAFSKAEKTPKLKE